MDPADLEDEDFYPELGTTAVHSINNTSVCSTNLTSETITLKNDPPVIVRPAIRGKV